MSKLLSRVFGLRVGRRGQTTAEYAIIVGLVAILSILAIWAFGNQIREAFFSSAKQIQGQDTTQQDAAEDAGGHDTLTRPDKSF